MTGWTDERIPIGVLPPWTVGASATRTACERTPLTSPTTWGCRTSLRRMVRRLTEGELELLERRTGVGAEQLRAMTLEAFDGSLVRITGQTRRLTAPANWRFYGTTSRYCPACLADNGGGGSCTGAWAGPSPAPATGSCSSNGAPLWQAPARAQWRQPPHAAPARSLPFPHRARRARHPLRLP
ncbi:TniQ family protein [Streptomyces sp. M10(2022)]